MAHNPKAKSKPGCGTCLAKRMPEGYTEPPFFVRAEIVVDPDLEEVVETAIARNTATAVKSISQAGARGHLGGDKKGWTRVPTGQS